MIWQGKPSFTGLALRSFHIREVAIYFGLLLAWRLWSNWSQGMPATDAAISALWLIVPAISGIAVLAGLAWLFRRAACYTITSKRVLFQFGVALPMTMNIPLSQDRQRGPENLSRRQRRHSAAAVRQQTRRRICCCGRISVRGGCGCRSRC